MSKEYYIPGDWWVLCDMCQRKVRSSKVVKNWKGQIVHADPNEGCFETRHPQEFVRAVKDPAAPLPFTRPDNDGIDLEFEVNCANHFPMPIESNIQVDLVIFKGFSTHPVTIADGATVVVHCLWEII